MSEDTTSAATETVEAAVETTVDYKAKFEQEREHSRTWEKRAKENKDAAKELEALKAQHMTETEKAIADAKAAAKAEAQKEFGVRLVDAEVRAAAAGRGIDTDALLDGLDRARFLDDDGQPDTDGISKWIERIAPKTEGFTDIGQGARGAKRPATSDPLLAALTEKLGIPT